MTDLTLTGLSGTETLTFTTSNWNTAQTVTVKAAQDSYGADDGVTLTHTAAGGEYAGTTATLAVTVNDDDRGIVLTNQDSTLSLRRSNPGRAHGHSRELPGPPSPACPGEYVNGGGMLGHLGRRPALVGLEQDAGPSRNPG